MSWPLVITHKRWFSRHFSGGWFNFLKKQHGFGGHCLQPFSSCSTISRNVSGNPRWERRCSHFCSQHDLLLSTTDVGIGSIFFIWTAFLKGINNLLSLDIARGIHILTNMGKCMDMRISYHTFSQMGRRCSHFTHSMIFFCLPEICVLINSSKSS